MATRQILVDDMTGEATDDVKTVTFSLDGRTYELDLGPETRAELTATLQPYLQHARVTNRSRTKASHKSSEDLAPLRHWARMNGYVVGDRGRISKHVRDAYAASL